MTGTRKTGGGVRPRAAHRRPAAVVLAAVLATAIGGCPHNKYEIQMKPDGQAVLRDVTVTRVEGQGDQKFDEEVARLAKAAGDASSRPAATTQAFKTRFTERTPDDVGGTGFYRRFDTSMGSAFFYTERFRGDDDLAATAADRLAAADRLTDVLIGWFAANLKDDPRFARLRGSMDTDLRRDIRNLSMITWAYNLQLAKGDDGEGEPVARILTFLLHRGYFTPAELPEVARLTNGDDAAAAGVLRIVRRRAAERMGLDAAAAGKTLAFLDDAAAGESLREYLRGTKEFKELKAKAEADASATQPAGPDASATQPAGPDASATQPAEPDSMDVLGRLADRAMAMSLDSSSDDVLEVRMDIGDPKAGGEVVSTNGDKNAETGRIEWSTKLEPRAEKYRRLSPLCYAVWVRPEKDFQAKHFGKAVLEGQALVDYCLWRAGLPAERAKSWDAFVESLKGGADLPAKLRAFHFADEPAPATTTQPAGEPAPATTTQPAGEAAGIVKSILGNLEAGKEKE